MKIDKKLISKYNLPVPRYTSYPPANHFVDFNQNDFIEIMESSNDLEPRLLAFYIHIPFCKKICFYCGCNSTAAHNKSMIEKYIHAVKQEILLIEKYIDKSRFVSQIHYGGGTPNFIPVEYIAEINNLLFSKFNFINKPEIAIECDPAFLDKKKIDEYKKIKFNRFSLGIQDFDTDILQSVNRLPSTLPIDELIDYIKKDSTGISVNLDFIYGLPGQTVDSFSETIQKAISIKPDRLVTFSYAHLPQIKTHQLILERKILPTAEQKTDMFLSANQILKAGGYKSIGFDHYVLPNDNLYKAFENNILHRNFQGYCTRETTGQVYAVGVSAISQLAIGYAQNTKNIKKYIQKINNNELPIKKGYKLTKNQMIVREIITELMCNFRINWSETASKFNVSVDNIKNILTLNQEELLQFETDGILKFDENQIEITENGVFFIRNVAASLDPEYRPHQKIYSKSI